MKKSFLAVVAVVVVGLVAQQGLAGYTPPTTLLSIEGGLHYTPAAGDVDGLTVTSTGGTTPWTAADVKLAWNIKWDSGYGDMGAWRYTYTFQNTSNAPIISDWRIPTTPGEFQGFGTSSMSDLTVWGSADGVTWSEVVDYPDPNAGGNPGYDIEFDNDAINLISNDDLTRNLAWGFYSLHEPVWSDWTSKAGTGQDGSDTASNASYDGTPPLELDLDTPVFTFTALNVVDSNDNASVKFLSWDGTDWTGMSSTATIYFDADYDPDTTGNQFRIVSIDGLVPEPTSTVGLLSLLATGGLGLIGCRRRRKKTEKA